MTGNAPRFAIRDTAGVALDPVVPETLRPFLLERADGNAVGVELIEREGSGPGSAIRRSLVATPSIGGGWTVETVVGDASAVGSAPNTDAVFDLLRSWAADDGWWREAFSWRRPDRASDPR